MLVEVAERRPGLPPEVEKRILDKFYRAGLAREGRVGWGVTICQGFVKAHGGWIWAENPRRRSGVPVHSPAEGRSTRYQAEKGRTLPGTGLIMSARSLPLGLLIEDEPEIRRFLRTTLPEHGFRLYEAVTVRRG